MSDQNSTATGSQAATPPSTLAEVLGESVFLMASSINHKFMFMGDIEWLIMPPLMLRQFRLWRDGNRPLAFATWAFLSAEVEERMKAGIRRLKPDEWNSGDRAWLMDVVAPNPQFAEQMVTELKKAIFPDRPLMGLKPRADGKGVEVAEL